MARLTRAEQQVRTRQKVLEAASSEFAERGFHSATVDGIAERADLTRGAVYSNFPGKRALYLAVLAHFAEQAPPPSGGAPADTPAAALEKFAGVWLQRIPRSASQDTRSSGQLRSPSLSLDLMPEIMSDERLRRSFSRLLTFDAIVLGYSMRRIAGSAPESLLGYVGVAESVLTILYGATQLSFSAPEFVDPAHVMALCGQVANLDGAARMAPRTTHRDRRPRPLGRLWTSPTCIDLMRACPARFDRRGMIAILGVHRLDALTEALSLVPADLSVTVAIVTANPGEVGTLARLAVLDFSRSLRHAFPTSALADLQVVVDESGEFAAACEVGQADDDTEIAISYTHDHLIESADGPDACRIMATWLAGSHVDKSLSAQ